MARCCHSKANTPGLPLGRAYSSKSRVRNRAGNRMRVIVIGAGRGRRLMPTTADAPKCFAEVAGKRLLDWAVEAFSAGGLDRVCFIGGYRIDKVKQDYPAFTFRHNTEWETN